MNCSINNHHVLARPSAHETKQLSKKKEKKPKSPRSAYQLFFQHEKEKILGAGAKAAAGSSTAGSSSYSRRPRDGKNGEALLSEIIANKGKLCVGDDAASRSGEDDVKAPLGEDSVEERDEDDELSREISRRWKDLDESARAIYDGFSILERKRYERELAWRGRAGEEGDNNGGLRASKAKAGKKRPLSTIQRCPEKEDAAHDLEPLQKKQKMRQRRRRSSRSSASEEEGASAVRAKKKKARAAAPKHKFLPAIGSCSIPKRAHPRRSGKPFRSQYVASSPERKMSPQPSEIQCSAPSAPLRTTTVVPSCDGSSVSSLSCCSAESPQPPAVRRPLSPLSEAAEAVADSSLLATGLFDPRPIRDAQPSPTPLLLRRAPPPPPLGSGLLGPASSPPLPSIAELNQFQRASSAGLWRVGGVDPLLLQKQQQQEEEQRMLADLYSPTPIGGGANEVTSVSSAGTANANGEESLDKESVGFLSSVFFAPVALIG